MLSLQLKRLKAGARRTYDWLRQATPAARSREKAVMARRAGVQPLLDTLSRRADLGPVETTVYSRVLVDGMWDNPNYWTRFAMIRAALGLWRGHETGMLGEHSRVRAADSFRRFGLDATVDLIEKRGPLSRWREEARRSLEGCTTPDDLIALKLPEDFPAELFYDGLLTRQRRGAADPSDPMLVDFLTETLANLDAAGRIMDEGRFDLVLLSHALNNDFAAIAWCAMRRGMPVIVLYGDFGTVRFMRIDRAEDFFYYVNSPTPEEVRGAPADLRAKRREAGRDYLAHRLAGNSEDPGAIFAYRRRSAEIDRAGLGEAFGWDPATPVVCVFGANWFDFPHSVEMTNFRDFQDWVEATLSVACETQSVNWLFKAHPCDDWYPSALGPSFGTLVKSVDAPNVRLVPIDWNGHAIMQAIDGGITYMGTIGIELPSIGKPVLVADRGWYGEHGFVIHPGDRAAYLDALKRDWWTGHDAETAANLACEFAGWLFATPDGDYIFKDDSNQEAIYDGLGAFLKRFENEIAAEIALVRDWVADGHRFYQVYKKSREVLL
jgi:hypothetical protein